jgi:hypothetical protein
MLSFLNAHVVPDRLVRFGRGGGGRRVRFTLGGGGVRRVMFTRRGGGRLVAFGPVIGRPNAGRRVLTRGLPARTFRKPLLKPRFFLLKYDLILYGSFTICRAKLEVALLFTTFANLLYCRLKLSFCVPRMLPRFTLGFNILTSRVAAAL